MKRSAAILLCLLLTVLLSGHSMAQPAKPLASAISQDLKDLYQQVSGREPIVDDTDRLISSLSDLEALNEEIRSNQGILATQLKIQLTTYRALGWLHSWAIFSRLAIKASSTRDNVWRKKLLDLSPTAKPVDQSALSLLLLIYKELASTEPNSKEPLQNCLKDLMNRGFALDLAYRPPSASIDYYIPSSADILGKPSDSKDGQRGILSMWALVNLQLDTWPDVTCNPLKTPCSSSKETLGLTPLVRWIDQLRKRDELNLFGDSSSFNTRADRIARFLTFRDSYASESNLNNLLDALDKTRALNKGDIKGAIPKDLLLAATPDDNGEWLYDAVIWLRYIVLLSYQKAHLLALYEIPVNKDETVPKNEAEIKAKKLKDEKEQENKNSNLENIWKKLNVDWPSLNQRGSVRGDAFLRWNQWPGAGHLNTIIADLTVAAERHLISERNFRQWEKLRLKDSFDAPELAVSKGKSSSGPYEKNLTQEMSELDTAFDTVLKPYFVGKTDDYWPNILKPYSGNKPDTYWQAEPPQLTGNLPMNVLLHTSGSASEVQCVKGDLAFAAAAYKSTQRRYHAILNAYSLSRQSPPQATAIATALRSMSGISPLSKWDPYTLPQRSFDQYKANLDTAIKSLQQIAEETEAKNRLRQSFRAQEKELNQSKYELLAAQLGKEVTEKAVTISEKFTRIANLDIEIASLSTRIDDLKLQAANNQAAANNQKLVLMTQLRDLAAAKVQAVTEASKQAGELAEQASAQLDTLKGQFLETAQKIEDQEKREHAFGLVKAIVSVVGAALAPFTGGASLTIAMLANMAIDIGKKIDETNWKDFGSALQAATEIGDTLAKGVTLSVGKFGSPDDKAKLEKVNLWIKSAQADVQKKLTDFGVDLKKDIDGNQVIEELKKLGSGNYNDALNFAAALANGYTLNVNDNEIHIDFKGQKIRIHNTALQKEINAILNQGRIILNDAGQRAQKDIEKLVDLPDEELKGKLSEAFRNAVTALPPELRETLKVKEDEAKRKVGESITNIQNLIQNQLSPDDRRSLAQALAAGLLFVKDGETVVLLKRPIDEEAKRFQARLDNFQKKVATDILGKFIKDIEDRNKELMGRGQKLSSEKNIAALRNLATTDIPQQVDKLKLDVENIKKQIDAAKGELEDKEKERVIANYEAKAAQLFVQAEELSLQRSKKGEERAQLQSDAAKLIYENSLKTVDQNDALVNAKMLGLQLKEEALQQTYEKCLAYGFNPLTTEEKIESGPTTPFRVLLSGFDGSSDLVDRQQRLDAVAVPLIGMIQWYRLLDIRDPRIQDPVTELISIVTSGKPLYEKNNPETIESKVTMLRNNLVQTVSTKAEATVDLIRVDGLTTRPKDKKFIWLGQEFSLSGRDWELRDVEPTLAKQVINQQAIGMFYVRFGSNSVPQKNQRDYTTYKTAPSINAASDQNATEASYYADLNSISLRIIPPKGPLASQGLSFLVIAPTNSFAHPARPLIGEANRPSRIVDISTSLDDATLKIGLDNKLGDWSKQFGLVGAFGEWKVLILANGVQTPEQRQAYIDELQATGLDIQAFRIGYLAVPFRK